MQQGAIRSDAIVDIDRRRMSEDVSTGVWIERSHGSLLVARGLVVPVIDRHEDVPIAGPPGPQIVVVVQRRRVGALAVRAWPARAGGPCTVVRECPGTRLERHEGR